MMKLARVTLSAMEKIPVCSLQGGGSIISNRDSVVQGSFSGNLCAPVYSHSNYSADVSLPFAGNGLFSARRWRNTTFHPSQKPLHNVRHTSKQSLLGTVCLEFGFVFLLEMPSLAC